MNLTELLELCRESGLTATNRGWPRAQIYKALDGELDAAGLEILGTKRESMHKHVQKNFKSLRTQLDCNGKCSDCTRPDIVIQRCWLALKDDIL